MEEGGSSRGGSVRSLPRAGGHPTWPSPSPLGPPQPETEPPDPPKDIPPQPGPGKKNKNAAKTLAKNNPETGVSNLPDLPWPSPESAAPTTDKTETASDKKKTTTDKKKTAPDNPKTEKTETAPDKTETAPDKTDAAPARTERAPGNMETGPAKTETVPDNTDTIADKVPDTAPSIPSQPTTPSLPETSLPLTSLTSDAGDSGISASNDSQYYAKMAIIDDSDSQSTSLHEEEEEDEPRSTYSRSISEPPRETATATPARKLSECEARGPGLTGLFFQRLMASEEGDSLGEQYRSSSSLASEDSARSEGASQGLLRKFESRASLHQMGEGGASPGMTSKFGSSFMVNKHKKVDLESFDSPQQPPPKKREARFSQGEASSHGEVFETGAIKKSASMATVETSPGRRVSKDPSLMGERFEGRLLLGMFSNCFTEDNYLRVSLTSQVCLRVS